MMIGIPRERQDGENRVAIIPSGVSTLLEAGYEVVATHKSFPTDDTVYFNCSDLTDRGNFDAKHFGPNVVVHCAAMTNVDGLFARAAIAAGGLVLTEAELPACELPVSATPNCEVAEDAGSGVLCLVATRAIASGEFLTVGADEDED